MHLGNFYTVLPPTWKSEYQHIDAPYEDCASIESWLSDKQPNTSETLWDLYKRFDPQGTRKMHLGHFYTVLPPSWKSQYKHIDAPYEDCLQQYG